eukprot:scaffold7.g3561.t1
MLDINLFRTDKGGDPEIVRESQRRRFADVGLVDRVLELDAKWRESRGRLDTLNMEFNQLTNQIKELRKARAARRRPAGCSQLLRKCSCSAKQDATELQEKSKEMKKGIKEAEELEKQLAEERDAALLPIGNLVGDSVPISNNEDNNIVVKTFGEPRVGEQLYNHVDLVQLLDFADLENGVAVAGSRGYYLKHEAVLLNQALINYALQFGYGRGLQPKPVMAECAQLSQFDEELYKVTGEGDEKYLIATSEQTLCAMHRRSWLDKGQLPLRVHQFEKVEQFVVTSPHDGESWKALDEMLANAEAFYQALGLPYRNCLDYQARRLDIRLRTPKGPGGESKKEYVHMLNGTLTATERTLCCVLENYQTPEGLRIPEVLRPFMMGIDFIPFRKAFDAKRKLVDRPAPPAAADGAAAAMSTS